DRASHFAPRLAEAVGGGIEPAAHRPAVVARPCDRHAQSPVGLRTRRGRGAAVAAPRASAMSKGKSTALIRALPIFIRSFGLGEGDAETEQRQAHVDRLLVGVL